MQITNIEVLPVELSLRLPYRTAYHPEIDRVTVVFVRVETRQGQVAWGCAAFDTTTTGETLESVLRASNACADNQNRCGGHLACRCDLAGEETSEVVRCLDHRAIPADVGHGRQCVHFLGTRNTWNHVHRNRRHAFGAQFFQQVFALRGPYEGNQRLTFTETLKLDLFRGADFDDEITGFPKRGAGFNNLDASVFVVLIGETRRSACSGVSRSMATLCQAPDITSKREWETPTVGRCLAMCSREKLATGKNSRAHGNFLCTSGDS